MASPMSGQRILRAVPIQTPSRAISDKHITDIAEARRCHGDTRLADLGITMDKIERSFVAAAAVSFVVLVISSVLLAVM